ncbi:CHAT domain-containing protein [Chryseosolibacter indicus]|uniref:CHAT domain-containing protein n=1 Tax=Chryseosolibacter indicus TaxID=2782351 RepID=A0ABS5VL37_9BACT|nr:CHAT domain-containing protein [Chryseosolibacter indicus]MBT1702159.1 CHAT domain-containing protein [Chryseosolibacter indicus]
MHHLRYLITAAVVLLLISQTALSQNKKLDKTLKKVDNYYNGGYFPKALKSLRKFKGGALKLGTENDYMVQYYIREARINLASGIIAGFEASINNALATSERVHGSSNKSHVSTLIDIAELYNEYGNYRISIGYIEKARGIIEKLAEVDEGLRARMNLVRAETLTGQGFYNEAIAVARSIENYCLVRAVEKETVVEGGIIKTRRIAVEELPQRFEAYARLLTLIARAYGKKGNLISADSAFTAAATWIKKNQRYMDETSVAYVKNNYLNSLTLIENGNKQRGQKSLELDNILDGLKKRVAPTHTLAQNIYLDYLKELIERGAKSKYNTTKLEYERSLIKYFPKTSLVRLNFNAVEFTAKFEKEHTKNLETNAINMLDSKSVPKYYRTTERILAFLTEVALLEKRYLNAENYLLQISEIKKELCGESSPEYHLSQIQLANFYLDYTNNIERAGKIYEESYSKVVSKEIEAWHKDHLNILNHLARYYEVMDKYALAATILDKASDVARSKYDSNDPDFAIEQDYLAQLQLRIGQYEKAEESINKALNILENYRKDEAFLGAYVHTIETQAKLFGIKGLFDEAESNLDRSRKLISKAKIALGGEVSSAEELSSLLIQLGRFSEADKVLNDQIPSYERLYGVNSLRLIEPLVYKGRILLSKGDYTEAERVALRANQLALKIYGDHSTKTAPTQKLLADIYYTLGDYDKAEGNSLKAIVSQENQFGRSHIEVAKSVSQLALIKFYKGDANDGIEKLMLEARDIILQKLGNENPQYAEMLKNLAVLYISEGKYDAAFNSLTVAEMIWRTKTGTKNNINAASIYTLTGDVYYQLKNYRKSEEFYNRARDLYEKFFSTRHPEYVKVLSKLSKVYYMEKDFKKSKRLIEESLTNYENFIKQYFPALSEREKAKYWNTIRGDFEFYNTLAFSNLEDFRDLTAKVYNYQLLTKALLLSSSIKIRQRIMDSNDEELKSKYNNWVAKKEKLTLALSMSPAQLTENDINPASLQDDVERIEKELSQKSEIFGQSFENKRISFDDIRKSLKPNEVAMEMVRYRYFNHTFTDSVIYAALYLTAETSKPKAIILKDGSKMETRYFKFYRNAITGRIPDNVSYNVYWKAISDELGQTSTVYLSADGIYNQINLEAIPAPDGRYIIDNSNIVLVSNTKDIFLRKSRPASNDKVNTASMFGNPTFYLTASADVAKNISALPGTQKEVDQLQLMLKEKGWLTSEYLEDAAAEEKIKELSSPKIFHIATHGLYKPTEQVTLEKEMEGNEAVLAQNPLLRTGLLLKGAGDLLDKTSYNYNMENGILTAYEAMSLNLDKTDLVVLSACETGLGDLQAGEGVYGLQRAFLVAGAKVLIMSMFKVDDEATQKLMLKFYQKWLNSGNLRESFIEAKKELRVEYPDPIHWGAFMMIGLQ